MAKKNSLLPWLFGNHRNKEAQQSQKSEPRLQAPVQDPPPAPPKPESFRLELPPNHAINKLWKLWREEVGKQPAPSFRFETADGNGEVLAAAQGPISAEEVPRRTD